QLKEENAQFQSQQSSIQQLQNVLNQKSEELDNREKQLKEENDQFQAQQNEIQQLQNKLNQKSEELDNREKQLGETNSQLLKEKQNLQYEIQQLQDKLEQENKELQDREKQLKEASSQLEKKQNSQKEIQQLLEQQRLSLTYEKNKYMRDLKSDMMHLNKFRELETELANSKLKKTQNLQNEIQQSLEQQNLELKKVSSQLEEKQNSLERISELELNLSTFEKQILSLIGENQQLLERISELETNLSEKSMYLQNFESEIKVLNKQIKRFREIISDEKTEPIEEFKSENVLQDLNTEIQNLDKILNSKIVEYRNEIENLKTQLKNEKQNLIDEKKKSFRDYEKILYTDHMHEKFKSICSELEIQSISQKNGIKKLQNENSNSSQQFLCLMKLINEQKKIEFPKTQVKAIEKYNNYSGLFNFNITNKTIIAMINEEIKKDIISILPTDNLVEASLQASRILANDGFFGNDKFLSFRPVYPNGIEEDFYIFVCHTEDLAKFYQYYNFLKLKNILGVYDVIMRSISEDNETDFKNISFLKVPCSLNFKNTFYSNEKASFSIRSLVLNEKKMPNFKFLEYNSKKALNLQIPIQEIYDGKFLKEFKVCMTRGELNSQHPRNLGEILFKYSGGGQKDIENYFIENSSIARDEKEYYKDFDQIKIDLPRIGEYANFANEIKDCKEIISEILNKSILTLSYIQTDMYPVLMLMHVFSELNNDGNYKYKVTEQSKAMIYFLYRVIFIPLVAMATKKEGEDAVNSNFRILTDDNATKKSLIKRKLSSTLLTQCFAVEYSSRFWSLVMMSMPLKNDEKIKYMFKILGIFIESYVKELERSNTIFSDIKIETISSEVNDKNTEKFENAMDGTFIRPII
ncbi:MAG: hypothetical protein LBJ32_02320, partial [Oscillospiraceae bacterium]|nr:hypothetical protein [Oscillospiraceae bacterium]